MWRELGVELPHRKESAEVVHLVRMPPFSGTSNSEEIQNTLEEDLLPPRTDLG